MPRKSKLEILSDIHYEALTRFDAAQDAAHDVRLECLYDRRFVSITGAAWEGQLGEQYENKPKFEIPKAQLAITRINNEYRNNRITVDFISKDDADDESLSDTCDKLFRADESDSVAQEAYDNSFWDAVAGGFSAWRLRTEYEDEEDPDNDYQRIRIEPIFDADSCVFFDPNAKRQDKADAKYCFVLIPYTIEAYKNEWDDDPASWPKDISGVEFDWSTPDQVYVAEYYTIEETKDTVYVFEGLDGTQEKHYSADFEDDPELLRSLTARGFSQVREKPIKIKRVHKYLMSGGGILEDCGLLSGKCIPIVPVYGNRVVVDGIERCFGHTRWLKDLSRIINMEYSLLAEISAASPVEKPIFTPEQMAGHAAMWAEDNIKNYSYLLVNTLTDSNGQPVATGPIGYTKPPTVPPALAALLQLSEADLQEISGSRQQTDRMVSNISGKAVDLIQQSLDVQTFIYVSNMQKAIQRSGEIWLSIAKDIYVEKGRRMKGIGRQNETEYLELLKPMMGKSGKAYTSNDLSRAVMDVKADVGPSSTSRKAATVRALTGMMGITQDPEMLQVLGSMAMMNMEGEGITEVRDYFRQKLLRMGVVKPTKEEEQQLVLEQQNTPPDPQAEYLRAAAQEAIAGATKAQADTVLTAAKAEESKAKTVEILAGVDNSHRESVVKTVEALSRTQANTTHNTETVPPM